MEPFDTITLALNAASVPTTITVESVGPWLLGLSGFGSADIVAAIADAIDRQEGPGAPRNNPGNLRTWGNYPIDGGFAVFPDLATGRAALEQQVRLNISRGLTLEEFFAGKPGVYAGYAPAADRNQPYTYARNVSAWTGIPLNVPLNQYTGAVSNTPATQSTLPTITPDVNYNSNTVYDTGTTFTVDSTASADIDTGTVLSGLLIVAAAALLLSTAD